MSLTEDQKTYVQRTFHAAASVAKETDYDKANALTNELGGSKLVEGLTGVKKMLVCMAHAGRSGKTHVVTDDPELRPVVIAIMEEPGFEGYMRDIEKVKEVLLNKRPT